MLQPQTKEELMEEEIEGEEGEGEGLEVEGEGESEGEGEGESEGEGGEGEGNDDSEEDGSMEEDEVDAQFRVDVMKALGSAAVQSEDEVTQKSIECIHRETISVPSFRAMCQ